MSGRYLILVAALLFGTTGTAQALASVDSPVAVGAMRILVGGAALVGLALASGAFRGIRAGGLTLLVTGIGVAVYQVSFFAAVASTGVAVGTVVAIGVGPVAAGGLEWMLSRTRQSGRWIAATAVAAAGVVTLTLSGGGGGAVTATGVALSLVAGIGYALYTVLARRLILRGCPSTGVMAAAFGIGAILLLPILAVSDLGWLGSGRGVTLALYLGLIPTGLAYVLFARGLRTTTGAEAATITLAEPATAMLLAAVVLDERLGAVPIAGIGLVLVAMLILLAPQIAGRIAEART